MRRVILAVVVLGALAAQEAVAGTGGPRAVAVESTELNGVAYGPFRDNESPGGGIYPTEEEIRADIALIAKVAKGLRTYSCTHTNKLIPGICQEEGLNCCPGAWLSTDPIGNEKELRALEEVLAKSYPCVTGVSVGGEVLLRGDMTESALINCIGRIKGKTTVPVSTAETWEVWRDHPALVTATDFILVHIYAYWDGVSIDDAAQYVVDKVNLLKGLYPGKRIVVGEVGWPSAGATHGAAVASPANEEKFITEFEALAATNEIEYFYFEMFDENWKAADPAGVERHWGIYNADGSAKFSDLFAAGISRPPRVVLPVEADGRLVVYGEAYDENAFEPWGFMGNTADLNINAACTDSPHSGDTCFRIAYAASSGWAGLYSQYPLNNWGQYPGYTLTSAVRLVFWARGEVGGEKAEFKTGGINSGFEFKDSFGPLTTGLVTLSQEWTKYEISLAGQDLSDVIGGFCVAMDKSHNPSGFTIYLDDIAIEPAATIEFTDVPPFGTFADLKGSVSGVNYSNYAVAVYIEVYGGWWNKPNWDSRLTPIGTTDGKFTCDITTGGKDQTATQIVAYLVPTGYVPPKAEGGPLPSEIMTVAIAYTSAMRSPQPLTIVTASLPVCATGEPYSQILAATGGAQPYAWSLDAGSLPAGLSLSAAGVISGTATGSASFTVRVSDAQRVADTATKALSISVVPGGPTYQFAANEAEASTTSTGYIGRVSLTFTPPAVDDWIIFGFCEFKCPNVNYATFVQLFVDDVGEGQNTRKPVDPADYLPFITVKVKNLTAAPHTVKLMYKAGNSSAAAYVRRARICAVRKAALEFWNAARDSGVPLTTALTDTLSLNWTPAVTGSYLVISTAEVNATTAVSTDVQTFYNGTLNDEGVIRAADNGDFTTFMSFNYLANAPAGVPIAHKIAAKKVATEATNHYIRRARILALRLSGGRFRYAAIASANEQTTTQTTWQQCLTSTWAYGVNGKWLFLNSARLSNSSTSCQTGVRVQLNNGADCGDQLMRPKATSDLLNFSSIDARNLTTPRTIDMDFKTTNAAGTAKVKRLRFYGLPLDGQ